MDLIQDYRFKYFPASWYPILRSDELANNQIKEIKIFNKELVIFRGSNGEVGILKSYCSHMGTKLKNGRVKDACIVCPLHLRETNNRGECVKIPKSEIIPKNSHTVSLRVHEFAGLIFGFLGDESFFDFPNFNKVLSKVCFSKSRDYVLNTPYQALIFNGFDTHHLDCIHSRKISENPLVEFNKEKIIAQYTMYVIENNWYDKVVSILSSSGHDIHLEVYGGNFMIITNKNTKDNILITSSPIDYEKSRIFLLSLSEHENGFLGNIFQKLRLWVTTYLGVQFLKPDLKIIDQMKVTTRNMLKDQDYGAIKFWEYWDQLPRDSKFQDKLD